MPRPLGPTTLALLATHFFALAGQSSAQSDLNFERRWPVTPQMWYFESPVSIAVDGSGHVYVADDRRLGIKKYSADGRFLDSYDLTTPQAVRAAYDGRICAMGTFAGWFREFAPNGELVSEWRIRDALPEVESFSTDGFAVHGDRVYVADALGGRVHVFTRDGGYIKGWNLPDIAPDPFREPYGIEVLEPNEIVVARKRTADVVVFDTEGDLLRSWSTIDAGVLEPTGIARIKRDTDAAPSLLVADQIQVARYDRNGTILDRWKTADLRDVSTKISLATDGKTVYLASTTHKVVQRYSFEGQWLQSWKPDSPGTESGGGSLVVGEGGIVFSGVPNSNRILATDMEGRALYEFETMYRSPSAGYPILTRGPGRSLYAGLAVRNTVVRYSYEGAVEAHWSAFNFKASRSHRINGLAVGLDGEVYVSNYEEIHKFAPDGELLDVWDRDALLWDVDLDIRELGALAVSSRGHLHVAALAINPSRTVILRVSPQGVVFDHYGDSVEDLLTGHISQLAFDEDDNLFLGQRVIPPRIRTLSPEWEVVTDLLAFGTGPGLFHTIDGMDVGPDGRVFVSDSTQSCVQVLTRVADGPRAKAIILPSDIDAPGDAPSLFADPVRALTLQAYQTLLMQGYTRDTVFLMHDRPHLDIHTNGIDPDVDAPSTRDQLEYAVREWASDADRLVLYLVGTGDNGRFIISGKDYSNRNLERLLYSTLDTWLDSLEVDEVLIIIDASASGSAIEALKAEPVQNRIVITSARESESAYFLTDGALSFSSFFWRSVFDGASAGMAFSEALTGMERRSLFSYPQMDANGDGEGNGAGDGELARNAQFFRGTLYDRQEPPVLYGNPARLELPTMESSATIGVSVQTAQEPPPVLVWGVATHPSHDFANSTIGYPTYFDAAEFEFFDTGDGQYEGTFHRFGRPGTYTVRTYVMDHTMRISDVRHIVVSKPDSDSVVSIRVVDAESHQPIPNARIELPDDLSLSLNTNEDGYLQWIDPPDGRVEISIDATDYEPQHLTLEVSPSVPELTIYLNKPETSTGAMGCAAASTTPPGNHAGTSIVILAAIAVMLTRRNHGWANAKSST